MRRHDYGAGYRLNEAVKCPTQALKRAARIGVLIHEEAAFLETAEKEAMLVVSYGAADEAAYEASLAAVMDAIAEEHPGVTVTQAFTSEAMIRRFESNTGIRLPRKRPWKGWHRRGLRGWRWCRWTFSRGLIIPS